MLLHFYQLSNELWDSRVCIYFWPVEGFREYFTRSWIATPDCQSLFTFCGPIYRRAHAKHWSLLYHQEIFNQDNEGMQKRIFVKLTKGSRKKNPPLMARPLRPYPPPLELNGHRNFFLNFFFSLKIAKNRFWHFFSSHNFWTKIALFFGKYCNNPPPPLNGSAISGGFFFAASLSEFTFMWRDIVVSKLITTGLKCYFGINWQ